MNQRDRMDGVSAAPAPDRRRFVRDIGVAVVAVHMLPRIAHAGAPRRERGSTGALMVRSSPGLFSHVHDLAIPYAVLSNPPGQGVELTTTKALLHTHKIVLTRNQLLAIHQGRTVAVRCSSHRFAIALTDGQGHGDVRSGIHG